MRKRKWLFFCCLVLLFILAFVLRFFTGLVYSEKQIYEKNWGMHLPDGMRVIYKSTSKDTAMGDAVFYTAFALNEHASQYFEKLTEKEGRIPQEEIKRLLSLSNANLQEYPDPYEECSFSSMVREDGSTLYILYNPLSSKAFLIQDMM